MWLAEVPQPRPPRPTWPDNPVFQLIQAGYARHHVEHPEFMGVHYIAADQVEECWQLLRQSMRSISFECLAHLPGYSAWLREQDWTAPYRRHRRNLQLIGLHDADKRWVLKNPSHLFALGALLAVYPDALVIQTHRAPRTAIASVCSLAAQASAGWSEVFTGKVLGRDQLELWASGLELFTAERATRDQTRFHDVWYDDLVADPVGTVEAIYRHFGLELSGAAADNISALAAAAPAGSGGPAHTYALEEFGLSDEEVDDRFGFYNEPETEQALGLIKRACNNAVRELDPPRRRDRDRRRTLRAEGVPRHDRARDRGRGRDLVGQPLSSLRLQGVDRRRDPVELHQRRAGRLPGRRLLRRVTARGARADRAHHQQHAAQAPGRPRHAPERLELLQHPRQIRLPAQGGGGNRVHLDHAARTGQGHGRLPRPTSTPGSPTGCSATCCGSPRSGGRPAATPAIR